MGAPEPVKKLTEAEYLAIERKAESKSEFFDGEMFAMAGGSPMHSLIATNLTSEVRGRLKRGPCLPFNSDLRLKTVTTGLITYPDLTVIFGPLEYATDEEDTVSNPTLLAEVLSDSTEAYDRGRKFEHYRQIASLREYLLVSQKEPRIEQFIRQQNNEWLLRETSGLTATLTLPSLKITIALSEVFAHVQFAPAPIRAQTPRR